MSELTATDDAAKDLQTDIEKLPPAAQGPPPLDYHRFEQDPENAATQFAFAIFATMEQVTRVIHCMNMYGFSNATKDEAAKHLHRLSQVIFGAVPNQYRPLVSAAIEQAATGVVPEAPTGIKSSESDPEAFAATETAPVATST